MKRTLALLLSAALLFTALFSLTACGVQRTAELPSQPASAPEESQSTESPAEMGTEPALPADTQQAVIEPAEEAPAEESDPSAAGSTSDIGGAEAASASPGNEALAAGLPEKPDIDINSWEFILCNSFNSLVEYYPETTASIEGGQNIDERVAEPAIAFLQAARDAGFSVWISTAHRNYEYCDNMYRSYLANVGDPVLAAEGMLGPGLNEHQTGLSIDFTDIADYSAWFAEFDDPYIKDSDLFRWLAEHCTEYGFILRYPEGKEAYYGTPCRHPAHFRYVGKEVAEYITSNNLCLEEFIMLYDESRVYLPKP